MKNPALLLVPLLLAALLCGCGVSEEALRGQSRQKNTATARQGAMYLCRNLTNMALTDIGAQFEGRNHATVLASIRKIEDMMQASQEFAMVIRDVTYNINSKA